MAFLTRAEGVERSLTFFESTASDTATQLVTMVHGRSLASELRRVQAENERLRAVAEAARRLRAKYPNHDDAVPANSLLMDDLADALDILDGA